MKPVRYAAAALAVAALLSACGTQAGSAAVVGDQTISDSQVADYTAEVQTQLAGIKGATYDESTATQQAVSLFTRDAVLTQVAARENITVTQGDIDTFLAGVVKDGYAGNRQAFVDDVASKNSIPESAIPAAAHSQLVYNAIATRVAPNVTDAAARSTAIAAYLTPIEQQIGVDVSPRFGTWNVLALGPAPQDLSILAPTPGTGGTPAPQPSAS